MALFTYFISRLIGDIENGSKRKRTADGKPLCFLPGCSCLHQWSLGPWLSPISCWQLMAVRIGSMVSLGCRYRVQRLIQYLERWFHYPLATLRGHYSCLNPSPDTGSACRLKGLCCDYIFYNFLPSSVSVHTDNRQRGVLMVGGRCDGSCLQPSGVDSVLIRCRMAEKKSYIYSNCKIKKEESI